MFQWKKLVLVSIRDLWNSIGLETRTGTHFHIRSGQDKIEMSVMCEHPSRQFWDCGR